MEYDRDMLRDLDLKTLIDIWAEAQEQKEELREYSLNIEMIIKDKMSANQQTVFQTERAKAVRNTNWDYPGLEALAEYMSPEDWEKILTAPRKPPPSRVDIRKAEAFARRYGNEAREIVDKCRDRLEKTLRLKKLTPKGDNTRGESTHGR